MKKRKTYAVQFRRKRDGRTDYRKRLKLLLSKTPRLVVRCSGKNIIAQVVGYAPDGDRILASVHSRDIRKIGWGANRGNIPTAYLVGLLIANKAKKAGIERCVLDIGKTPSVKGSRVYALVKGAVDSGLEIPVDDSVFPNDDRISGRHIERYAALLKEKNVELYNRIFSDYIKVNLDPTHISAVFEQMRDAIKNKK